MNLVSSDNNSNQIVCLNLIFLNLIKATRQNIPLLQLQNASVFINTAAQLTEIVNDENQQQQQQQQQQIESTVPVSSLLNKRSREDDPLVFN